MLRRGADPNARDPITGATPLHHAVCAPLLVTALLAAGADPNAVDRRGSTPLHRAMCMVLPRDAMVAVVDGLLRAGANARAVRDDGWTVLHAAALLVEYVAENDSEADETIVLDVMRLLRDAGADVRAVTEVERMSVLHCLARNARGAMTAGVEYLLDQGADPNAPAADGSTPLHTLCGSVGMTSANNANGENLLIALLNGGASVGARDALGRQPLHRVFMNVIDDDDEGRRGFIWQLCDHGADPNARDNDGRTPLHHAARIGIRGFVDELLQLGANLGARDNNGRTPLHEAAGPYIGDAVPEPDYRCHFFGGFDSIMAAERLQTVEVMLVRWADVRATDSDGRSPLDVAVAARVPNDHIGRSLLLAGAFCNRRNPLHRALLCRLNLPLALRQLV